MAAGRFDPRLEDPDVHVPLEHLLRGDALHSCGAPQPLILPSLIRAHGLKVYMFHLNICRTVGRLRVDDPDLGPEGCREVAGNPPCWSLVTISWCACSTGTSGACEQDSRQRDVGPHLHTVQLSAHGLKAYMFHWNICRRAGGFRTDDPNPAPED